MGEPWTTIDRLRRQHGLTLRQLATICGVSAPAVQQWKAGGGVSIACIQRLSAYFKVSADEFLPRPGATSPTSAVPPLVVRETPAPYVACRLPKACDLPARLDEQARLLVDQGERLKRIEAQVETLVGLLGSRIHLCGKKP